MADRYWVGGTATWDNTVGTKWATTSGGTGGASVPTSADDVFFDSGSGVNTVTITGVAVNAKSINCTGFTGTITGVSGITVAGSITLVAGQTYTHTGTVTITGTGTLTTAGKTFSPLTINGSGITVTLGDALNLNQGNLIVTQGTFTTSGSNYSITAGRLQSDNSNVRTITLNASTVTLNQGSITPTVGFTTSTNLTFNAGTSTINCNQPNTIFNGGSQTFYNVAIGDTQNNSHTMTGANTFNNLTINNRSANGTNKISIAANITVNGTFTSNGTQTLPYRRCWIYSDVAGTNRTITAAAISIFGTDFRNITGAGAASWTDSSRTNYWGDASGNSGITFATGRNAYWNLAGTQLWTATAWALTNNGTPADANYPLVQDTAIFTEAGAAGTVQLTSNGVMIPTLTMADGVSNRTSAMTLNFASGDRDNFFGSITFFSNLTLSGGGARALRLSGYNNTQSITTAGKTLVTNLEVAESFGNTVQLQDDLTLPAARTLTLTTGTFNANGFNVSTGLFSSTNTNTRTLTLGNGLWTLTGAGSVWNLSTTTGLTFNKGTSDILLSDTSTNSRTFAGGGLTYNKLTIGGATGTSTLVISGSNTFSELASTKTVAHTVQLGASLTQTITTWSIKGTAGNVVTVQSASFPNTQSALNITNKTDGIDYLSCNAISSSNRTPITFYAGANSTNGQNNTGIAFIASSTASPQTAYLLTSGTTFTVPSDWNSSNNNIYMIGAGGGGAAGAASGNNRAAGGGGGGGAFTQLTNFTATPSSSITYAIGTSASNTNGGNTTWDSGTYIANGGSTGTATTTPSSTGGAGGTAQTVSGIITVAFAGGNGGAGAFGTAASTGYGSGAGGGAGGPNGVGGNGGTGFGSSTAANMAGGGGGGNGGGSNGGNAASATFGNGGNNFAGIGGATTVNTAGTFGGGGSGAVNTGSGGSGGSGIDILNTLGGSGGKGGAAQSTAGTNAGLYGGGSHGGTVTTTGGLGNSGAGSQGVIFIVYTPSAGGTILFGSSSINGTATVTGLGNYTALGIGSMSASATVSSSSSLTFSVNGAINGTATVGALGGLSQFGIAYINGTASVSALGGLLNSGQASITANGTVTANGGLLYSGQASVNGTATVTADGYYIADGVAAISAFADVTAIGNYIAIGTAGITANGTVIANGVIQGEGWNPITPSSDTWTTVTAGTETWTDISPSTDIWLRQG